MRGWRKTERPPSASASANQEIQGCPGITYDGSEILVSIWLSKGYVSACHHVTHHQRGEPPGVPACGGLGLGLACSRFHENGPNTTPRSHHLKSGTHGLIYPFTVTAGLAAARGGSCAPGVRAWGPAPGGHPGTWAAEQCWRQSCGDNYSAGCRVNLVRKK